MGCGVDILANALFLGNAQHEGHGGQHNHNMNKGPGLPDEKAYCPPYEEDDSNDV